MERENGVYAFLCFNAILFVILMSTNITAGIIYLFCFTSIVTVCVCFACVHQLCEKCEPCALPLHTSPEPRDSSVQLTVQNIHSTQ